MRIATWLLLLVPLALHAQEEKLFEPVYLDPALKTGDMDAHAAMLAKRIAKGDTVALRRWQVVENDVGNPRPVYDALAGHARNDFAGCGFAADAFADEYIELGERFETDLGWQKVARARRGITEAVCIGPFAEPEASAHDDVFSPEVMLDFAAEYDGAWGRIKWTPVKHYDELTATLEMGNQQRWTGYCYYVATALVVERDCELVLRLKFGGSGKVWLNGEYVLDVDRRREQLADESDIEVKLLRGRNLLMVKLSEVSSLRVRAREKDGRIPKGVLALAPKAGDKPLATGNKLRAQYGLTHGYPHELSGLGLAVLTGSKESNLETIAGLLALADASQAYGLHDKATEAAEKARTLMPGYPLPQLHFLRHLDKGRFYSSSERRRLTLAICDGLLAVEAELVPAILAKAQLLADDERWREAVELLKTALPHTAAKWRIHLALANVYRDAGWPAEQEAVLKAALKAAPDALPVLRAASDFYASQGAAAREIELDRMRLAITPGDPDVHLSLANTLGRTADPAGAVKHFRALVLGEPASDFLQARLAEALCADGKLTEALAIYELLAARSVTPERELNQAARACLQLGREEQGAKYLERALQADPGDHASRRQLQRMRNESEDFWSGHALAWDEVMKHDVTREQFPRANSALVLDELIQFVYPDGSSISYTHIVRKILTQEGVDERGKEQINGELVTARTVYADGTVLEPISQPGGLVEFPGVKIGAYLDIAYITRSTGGPHETLDGDAFYFMDLGMAEPFAISRFVIIAPPAKPQTPISHNLQPDDAGVSITQVTAGNLTVRTWDVRNPRLPEAEPFMSSPQEVIPWIQFVRPRDWRARARKVASDGQRQIMQSSLIEQRAKELTKDVQGPRERARAIYKWVNETFTTEGDAWNAHQALKAGAGDRTQLFISLCAAAGLEPGFAAVDYAPVFKAAPEERLARPHWAYPHEDDFAASFIVLGRGDERVFVNLEDRLRPFGAIPARLFNAPAILWQDGGYSLIHLPGGEREKDRFENFTEITLQADGSAKVKGSITVAGERCYALKENMRTASHDQLCNALEADLVQQLPGFEADKCIFGALDTPTDSLIQEYSGTVKRMGTVTTAGMTLELPGEKIGRLLSVLVGARKREFDIELTFDLVQYDEVRITPPEGYVFKELPAAVTYPTAPLVYELKFELDEGTLVMKRKLVLGPGRFKAAEYNDLVEQIKRITQAEAATLKLRKS